MSEEPLLSGFRDFVEELIRIKRWVAAGAPFDDRNFGSGEAGQIDALCAVKVRLRGIINALDAQSERLGGIAYFEDSKYAMTALADETFLHLVDWDGHQGWRETKLKVSFSAPRPPGNASLNVSTFCWARVTHNCAN